MTKTNPGNFFEDYRVGQILHHATPRTLTEGDVGLYMSLYGPRFAVQSADTFARSIGRRSIGIDIKEDYCRIKKEECKAKPANSNGKHTKK